MLLWWIMKYHLGDNGNQRLDFICSIVPLKFLATVGSALPR
jgi:hypothetical protein